MSKKEKQIRKRNIMHISIFGFLLLCAVLFFAFGTKESFLSYEYQCSLPSCPIGYTSASVYCDRDANKCYRECEKQLEGSCGSYGSFFSGEGFTKLGWDGDGNHGDYFNTNTYKVSSNYCYKFYSKSSFRVDDWGSADSYKICAGHSWDSRCLCTTVQSATATTSIKTLGRGEDGKAYSAQGVVYEYGRSTCEGGQPWFGHIEGKLDVDLYVSRAPWIEGKIDTIIKSCNYECDTKSDCGEDGYIGSTYCKDNNVHQLYRTHTCFNYDCSYSDSDKLKESCDYGCASGACIPGECITIDTKCDDSSYYICLNNYWVNQGEVTGKCGVEEIVEEEIIDEEIIDEEIIIEEETTIEEIIDVIFKPSTEEERTVANYLIFLIPGALLLILIILIIYLVKRKK